MRLVTRLQESFGLFDYRVMYITLLGFTTQTLKVEVVVRVSGVSGGDFCRLRK